MAGLSFGPKCVQGLIALKAETLSHGEVSRQPQAQECKMSNRSVADRYAEESLNAMCCLSQVRCSREWTPQEAQAHMNLCNFVSAYSDVLTLLMANQADNLRKQLDDAEQPKGSDPSKDS